MAENSTMIPGLRYADPSAAIDWLCKAFGYEAQGVFRDDAGQVVHAQLVLGGGMIMLGPDSNPDMRDTIGTPNRFDGRSTQAVYVVVDDADAHHDRAVAAGAKVIKPLEDADYGGRGNTCEDSDGHVWEFGTYDPWAAPKQS